MNRLPLELTTMVLSHIERHRSRYARVNQTWQHIIEATTFAEISITGTSTRRYTKFKRLFAPDSRDGPRRQTLVRSIRFCVILPDVSQNRQSEIQSTKELTENNIAFTEAIVDFSSFLSSWLGQIADISLAISAIGNESGRSWRHEWVDGRLWLRNYCSFVGFDLSTLARLRPHAGGKLDVLPRVGQLTLSGKQERRFHPIVLQVLGEALPKIQKMELTYCPVGRRRIELRVSLGRSLLSLATTLMHLTHLKIHADDSDPGNQQFAPGNMLNEASSRRDMFSVGLRAISQIPSLRTLDLNGCHILTSELFEDRDGIDSSGSWPSLTHLTLDLAWAVPYGGWYITDDPSSAYPGPEIGTSSDYEAQSIIDSDNSDVPDFTLEHKREIQDGISPSYTFRLTPMVPFLLAMIRAVSRMPEIKKVNVSWGRDMLIRYFVPPERSEVRHDDEDSESFHYCLAGTPRWIFFLSGEFAEWEFPRELKRALTKSVGKGNTRIGRFMSMEWMTENPHLPSLVNEKF